MPQWYIASEPAGDSTSKHLFVLAWLYSSTFTLIGSLASLVSGLALVNNFLYLLEIERSFLMFDFKKIHSRGLTCTYMRIKDEEYMISWYQQNIAELFFSCSSLFQ